MDEKVWFPYVVMLANLPVKKDAATGRIVSEYSNAAATKLLTDFVTGLRTTVKVIHNKHGVILKNCAACAYACFNEYHHAEAVDEAFRSCGRSFEEYVALMKTDIEEDGVVYGWLADSETFEELAKYGVFFKDRRRVTFAEIAERRKQKSENSKRELQQAQQKLAETNDALASVEADLKVQYEKTEQTRREYQQAKLEHLKKRRELRQNLDSKKAEFYRQKQECDAQIVRIQNEIHERDVTMQEKFKALEKKRQVENALKELNQEYEVFDHQCHVEDMHNQELSSSLEQMIKESKDYEERCRELSEKIAEQKRRSSRAQDIDMARSVDLHFSENECLICGIEFEEILPYEEQQRKGISNGEFDKMNAATEQGKRKCWRNLIIPCLHANVCGACLHEWCESCKEKNKTGGENGTCPKCCGEISVFFPLRFSQSST